MPKLWRKRHTGILLPRICTGFTSVSYTNLEDRLSDWHAFLHLRDNTAGEIRDLWYHEKGCNSWLVVTRNTMTHEIIKTELVKNTGERRA